jgi:hypothetical protein
MHESIHASRAEREGITFQTPSPSRGACTANTSHTTASTNAILAIDLGKYKNVVCVLYQATTEYRFTSFDTSQTALRHLLTEEQTVVVLIEACLLVGWGLDMCNEVGVPCLVANAASDAWKFIHQGSRRSNPTPIDQLASSIFFWTCKHTTRNLFS